ncbi:isoprenylcysteine carboxylmethyltransferase family protein [Neisseriaceae bacterium JH1-16]|nr:isoprenylcysteine carboxylmethyltransferase family protein [Neisseriaceae bacterium JH1-16]
MSITPKLAAVTLLATGFYLGLAIVGRGGWAAFSVHPQLLAVALITLGLTGAALFTSGNISPGEREDRRNRWVLPVFGIIGLLTTYLSAVTDRLDIWSAGGETTRWLGVVLYLLGGVLRIWPVFVLGRRFSGLVAIQPGHTLVTDGIYRTIRNPSYLGLLVNSLGWALAFRSLLGVLLTALLLVPLIARIRAEEALLREQFGAEYDAYCAHTWRLIPWLY